MDLAEADRLALLRDTITADRFPLRRLATNQSH